MFYGFELDDVTCIYLIIASETILDALYYVIWYCHKLHDHTSRHISININSVETGGLSSD